MLALSRKCNFTKHEESFSEEQPGADIIVEQTSVSDSEDMDVFEEPVSKGDKLS